jgi:septal ring factor EnvC (AmiA/AmiB activator)
MPPKRTVSKIPKDAKQYYDMDDSSVSSIDTPIKEVKPARKKKEREWMTHAELETQVKTLKKKLRTFKAAIRKNAEALNSLTRF